VKSLKNAIIKHYSRKKSCGIFGGVAGGIVCLILSFVLFCFSARIQEVIKKNPDVSHYLLFICLSHHNDISLTEALCCHSFYAEY